MRKQITFTPEREASRDLTYSEHSSCYQSLHILLQDNGVEQYKFLLKVYREIITSYLSYRRIENAASFLRNLVPSFEKFAEDEGITSEDFQKVGIYIVVSTHQRLAILSSDDSKLLIGIKGEYQLISRISGEPVSRLPVNPNSSQKELFPCNFSDYLKLFSIELPQETTIDVVMGCGREDRGKVLEFLQTQSSSFYAAGRPLREKVPLKFSGNKVLAISFSAQDAQSALHIPPTVPLEQAGTSHRILPAIALSSVVMLIIVVSAFLAFKRSGKNSPPPESVHEAGLAANPRAAGNGHSTIAIGEASGLAEMDMSNVKLSLEWQRSFSKAVTSSPAATGDIVIFGCRDGNLYALDIPSGETKWQYQTGSGIGASPALSGDKVVCANYKGEVFCLNVLDGAKLWNKKLPGKIISSPLIAGKKVVLGCYDNSVYCLALGTGDVLWKVKTGGMVRATAATLHGLVTVPSYDGNLYAITLGTGSIRWQYKVGGNLSCSPAASGSAVIVGGLDGTVFAIEIASGKLLWRTKTGKAVKSSISIRDDKIFVGSNDNYLYCLDLASGSVLWKYGTGDIVLSRPCIWNKLIFAGSYDRNLYLLNTETGDKLDSYIASESIYSSPAVAGDRVLFGDNAGKFYCLRFIPDGTS